MEGFGRDQLIKYTPLWKGERFPDGRPRIPDALIEEFKLVHLSSEEAAWGPLRIVHGYNHQWVGSGGENGEWKILNGEKGLVGRAFTCEFMPGRKEISDVIEGEARAKGQSGHNKRMMDMLLPGDVLVCDMAGGEGPEEVIAGDQLATAIFVRTGNGFVVNGGIRDQEGIEPQGYPVYMRRPHPGTFKDMFMSGINVPIRIGEVTVMPGDLVVGDREGVTFIPPHTAQDIIENAHIYQLADQWRMAKYKEAKGRLKPSDLYGQTEDMPPELAKECHEFVNRGLVKAGKSPITRERWSVRGYSGSGCYPRSGLKGEKKPE
jgi:regulator of RNase E activity RraA